MKSDALISGDSSQARVDLGLDAECPVGDLCSVFCRNGYVYAEERFDEGFAGFCRYVGGGKFLIGYNLRIDYGEQFKRFTLAHELGHVFMPDHQKKLRSNQIMHRSYFNVQYSKDTEKEADCFSAHFLAPSTSCERIIGGRDSSPATIAALAEYFNISLYAAALRFIDLTDICCALVFCNTDGRIKYERRSRTMGALKHRFIYNAGIHEDTLASEFLKGTIKEYSSETLMNYWYNDLGKEVSGTEAVLDLGYDGRFAVILTSHVPRIDEYLQSEDY
jgi:hypothetical protein